MLPSAIAVVGVANILRGVRLFPNRTASVKLTPACAFEPLRFRLPDPVASPAVGVGHNEHPISEVRRTDARSRNNKRLNLVACTSQVSAHTLEDHAGILTKQARNVLCHDPSGSKCPYAIKHRRPEETVILCALSLPGRAERLAGKSSAENSNGFVD